MSSTPSPTKWAPTKTFIKIGCGAVVIATATTTLLGILIIKNYRYIPLQKEPEIESINESQSDSSQPGADESLDDVHDSQFTLPTTGVWKMTCQHTHQEVLDEYGEVDWKLTLYWDEKYFESIIDASNTTAAEDKSSSETFTWHEEIVGDITTDGFLWGNAIQTNTSSIQYWENEPNTTTHVYDTNWLGAISEDLTHVCFFRVGATEIDLDWIRERGRQEMLDDPGGLCEGLCVVK